MPGNEDDIEVRVILEDEFSRPADDIIRQEGRIEQGARNAADATDELSDAQARNTRESESNARASRDNANARDRQTRSTRDSTTTTDRDTTTTRRNSQERERSTTSIFKQAKGWFQLGKILKLFKFAIMADGMAKAFAGAAAAGGILIGAIGGLAPLTGVLLPLPALLAGAGLAFATFKMGFSGMSEAVSAYDPNNMTAFNEAIKDMGPNGQAAARGLAQVKEQFKPIQKMVQENLLDGFGDTIKSLGDTYFPVMEGAMDDVSKRMKGVMDIALGFLQLPDTVSAVGSSMGTLSFIAEQMGHAFNGALRGTLHMFTAVAPVAEQMSEMIAQGINSLADTVFQNQGKIRDFAQNGLTMFQQMMGTIVDLFIGFKNIASGGSALFDGMGSRFGDMAERFKQWTRSVEGQAKIKEFFATLRPIFEKLIDLVVDLAKMIGRIAGDNMGTLGPMIDKFREMVPSIEKIVTSASGAAPAFLAIAEAVLQMVGDTEALTPTTAILEMAVPVMEGLANAINALPAPLQTVIGYIVTFSLLLKTAAFQAMWAWVAQTRLGTIAIANFRMGMALAKISLMQFLAAQWAAFIASPIGIFIAIVLVLVGIFVLLWFKCEAFRNLIKAIGQWFVDVWNNQINPLVQKTWQWMQQAWDKILEIVRGAIDWIVNFFTGAWDKIKTVVSVFVTIFKAYFNILKTIVMTYVTVIVTIFQTVFNAVKAVVMAVVNAIMGFWRAGVAAWKAVLMPFINFFGPIFMGLVGIIKAVVGLIVAIFGLAWNIVRLAFAVAMKGIEIAIGWVSGVIGTAVAWISNIFNIAWTFISTMFGIAMDWIGQKLNTVKAYFQAAWAIITMLVGVAIDWISTKFNQIMAVVNAVLSFVVAWFQAKWAEAVAIVTGAIDWVRNKVNEIGGAVSTALAPVVGWFQSTWATVSGVVGGVIETVKGYIGGVIDKVASVLQSVKDKFTSVFGSIRDFVMGIIDRITSAISGITSVVSGISGAIGSVADFVSNADGGPITGGMTSLVGERGPEAFVTNTGKIKGVGMGGPEFRKFSEPGYIVPNHVLAGQKDSSVPNAVMGRLTSAMRDGASGPRTAVKERPGGGGSAGTYMDGGGGGDTYDFSGAYFGDGIDEAGVERAVKKAMDKKDRNDRERG